MFGMLSSLAKATVGVVIETPISIVHDAANKGVMLSEDDWRTEQAIRRILENLEDATDPE
jgi:Flp pilus assembly CpaE family ATPase